MGVAATLPELREWTLHKVFYGCGEKKEAKKPNSTPKGIPGTCQGPLGRVYPPNMAKNRGILILRTHVSPHLRAEA